MITAFETGSPKSSKEKLFLYDIVANGCNGIDVDKFDYIVRDSRACGLGCNFQFQRSNDPQAICCSSGFAPNILYACKSEGA
ncbi:hypothetical protein ACS0TY_000495 [Phlomoides rotata]